ncbi:metallophosphoesterase [Luteolibacter arcticus]|uniref:Metallophosphoesterase n=1 Tax=Luteolibacter arcticus TaxID=1581411 RepID=A0ABT3GG72_9BACT|nr:metallophosphoesterase [Luteolibacter arcticus]MCW1922615.1 metallophosphoesterase [Luteolibacter arcticus]
MKRRHFLGTATALLPGASLSLAADEQTQAQAQAPLLRFGLIADAQYADADAEGERHYRATPEKLKRAVETIRAAKPAFTLHLGDFIDRDFKSFDTMLPLINELGHPVYHLLGNHDYTVADGDKARVVATLGMPHDYYTFRSGNIRIVMLDTNSISTYKNPKDSPATAAAAAQLKAAEASGSPGAKPWNGGVSDPQLEWLDRELAAADFAKEHVIVCGHHPLLPADMHQLWNFEAVLAVLDRHPSVVAWFNGHNHAGDFVERNGRPYLTFRSMLHHPENTAFSIIDVHADRIVVTGHGREITRTLEI